MLYSTMLERMAAMERKKVGMKRASVGWVKARRKEFL